MAFRTVIYSSGLQIVKKELLKKCEMTPLIIDFGQTEVYNALCYIEF